MTKLTKENCRQTGGFDLINFYWICLPMSWQSGVSFDSGILISWAEDKKDQWVQPMPTRQDLHGFDCINTETRLTANPVPLCTLSDEAQKYHRDNGNVFKVNYNQLFNTKYWIEAGFIEDIPKRQWEDTTIEAVANYGRGPVLKDLKAGCHEKEEQDDFSLWFANTSWLIQ